MPTTVNGIGTWYYGKRRVHRYKSACSQCHALAELESYDTTLYFVLLFIPIIPLGQKRIVEQCSACRRHRVVRLKDWEAGKSTAFAEVLEKLRAQPDDKQAIQAALAAATGYQDELAFDRLADTLAGHRTNDADIQAQLGGAYEYFSRWPEAETAYKRALAVAPTDPVRERLAVALLKQERPEEAIQYITHVFEEKDPDKAWLTFWLIEGCLARGLHEQALDLMDVRDQAFPQFAKEKGYKRQRQTAEKHKDTGKPVPSTYLRESAKTGYSEGSGLGFKWPKYVAAAVFLGLIALYLGVAFYRGRHRPVWLVNGWTKPYAVNVNGERYQLNPGAGKRIEVAEGDVAVDWPESGDGVQTITIQTSFFGRPFHSPVFVINPDRCAILQHAKAIYAEANNPAANPAPTYSTGKLLTPFPDTDYQFEPFPTQISIKAGSRVHKTRVGLVPLTNTQDRISNVMAITAAPEQQAYVRRLVQLDPDDVAALGWLCSVLPPPDALALTRTRLGDRPVRVEWHKAYQSLVGVASPETDLTPEYRRLVDETNRAPDALYLLGGLQDGATGETLYEEAANANPPSLWAYNGLVFRCMVRGDFESAVRWAKKATELAPPNSGHRVAYLETLVAAGKHQEVIAEAVKDPIQSPAVALSDRFAAHLALGGKAAADAEMARIMPVFAPRPGDPASAQNRTIVELHMALAERDRTRYLELAARVPNRDEFTMKLLSGEYKAAAEAGPAPGALPLSWGAEVTHAALLYLAGLKAKDAVFAEESWNKFGLALSRGDGKARRLASMVAGNLNLDLAWIKSATFRPTSKRVILTALARQFPKQAPELLALARKLDYERDETSLCLRYVTE